ncbi:carboxymuconolactone decarboxylase family protein [Demequina rhizosphaerae]|uniref:carboxymuconolactone decarboxylase family protein n=1 Tax=Demequina rhizosphaerae TaxID=1638985 RepID=UPI000782E672|nr:carboxymuconolactone decarboxylase family protein [Demequina rhizosphaerae]
MGRIPDLVPERLSADGRALYDSIASGPRAAGPQHFALTNPDGSLRGPFNAMLLAPGLGAALQDLGAAIRYRGTLTDRSREIAILLVAARWDSAFEREAHEAVGRATGLADDELAALRREDAAAFAGVEGAVARATVALLDGDLDDAAWADAEEALGAAGVLELSTLVGYYATLALQLRVFRVGV